MGCNCKKKAKNASKYTDEETLEELKGVKKFKMFISKVIIAVLIFLILIVLCPIIIVYCMICLITGKKIKLTSLIKKNKHINGTGK